MAQHVVMTADLGHNPNLAVLESEPRRARDWGADVHRGRGERGEEAGQVDGGNAVS